MGNIISTVLVILILMVCVCILVYAAHDKSERRENGECEDSVCDGDCMNCGRILQQKKPVEKTGLKE